MNHQHPFSLYQPSKRPNKRVVRVRVTTDLIVDFVTEGFELGGATRKVKCIKGVPEDAVLIHTVIDIDGAYLIFQHESFDEVPDACMIPDLRLQYETRVLRTVKEWIEIDQEEILDPDGFRPLGEGYLHHVCDYEEFQKRITQCTIKMKRLA